MHGSTDMPMDRLLLAAVSDGLNLPKGSSSARRIPPEAGAAAFPESCMVFAAPNRKCWPAATDFLDPWMIMGSPSRPLLESHEPPSSSGGSRPVVCR